MCYLYVRSHINTTKGREILIIMIFVAVQSLAVLEEKTYCRLANVLVSISLRDTLIHALPTKVVNVRNRTGEGRRRQTLCDKRDNNFV